MRLTSLFYYPIMNINNDKQGWTGGGPKVLSEYDDLIIRNFYSYGVTYTATGVTVNLDGPVAGGLYMRHGTEGVGGAIIVFGYLWDRPIFYRIANHRIISEYYL